MTIRLLIVDGHPLIRWGMARIADEQVDLHSVGEAASAAEALRLAAVLHPQVVTVGVALPDVNGLTLARDLRDRYPELGIVVLTSQGEDDVLFRALDTGVSAFVPKTAPVSEILGAIRHAAVAASSFTATGLAEALRRRRKATDPLALSPREREVLVLLQEGRSVPVVAQTLFVSLSTAKTYVSRLYGKLGAHNRSQALMTAVRLGFVPNWPDPPPAG
jgi:DNA-binding NarL/FixJ family response regulator